MNIELQNKNEYEKDLSKINSLDSFNSATYINEKSQNPFGDIKVRLKNILENLISPKELTVKEELNAKFLDLDFGSEFDIDATKIGVQDAIFFINLLNQENLINYSVNDDALSLKTSDNKSIGVTKSLLSMLQTSIDTNKPIRLDFDKDVTVILKMDKDGKIHTHFVPGTTEIESYLKNNIQSLKQRFDEQNINYSTIQYSKYKGNNQSKKQKRSNK